jgi:hypothetical protein
MGQKETPPRMKSAGLRGQAENRLLGEAQCEEVIYERRGIYVSAAAIRNWIKHEFELVLEHGQVVLARSVQGDIR